MFPIYGMAIFLEPFFVMLSPVNFLLRGLVYAVLIYAAEFITGSVLKRANVCPWDYSHTKYHVKGLVRLDYLPGWVALGLLYEQIYWFFVA